MAGREELHDERVEQYRQILYPELRRGRRTMRLPSPLFAALETDEEQSFREFQEQLDGAPPEDGVVLASGNDTH